MCSHPRLIPVLLLKHGLIVRSQLFKVHQAIGNPMSTVQRFSNWNVDELIVLDISRGLQGHDLRRDDLQQQYLGETALDVLAEISKVCFMPLTFGGRISSFDDIEKCLAAGSDKISINTAALNDPAFLEKAAHRFGTQCIVASIDAQRTGSTWKVMADGGRRDTGRNPAQWARDVQERGAGEILLNSIDRDGSGHGYDIDLIRLVSQAVFIPVVACGGVGRYEDFPSGIQEGGASAIAAANFFHFFEMSYPLAKQVCLDEDIPMRPVSLGSPWFPREPVYDREREDNRLEDRLTYAHRGYRLAAKGISRRNQSVHWCASCVYPSISAAPMEFDDKMVCTGCLMAGAKDKINDDEWRRRKELLVEILAEHQCRDGSRYDCVIPVSGGKDSYFQTHVIKNELGFNPLLVTYNGNNWTDVGWRNMLRMKKVFNVDHILVSPSIDTIKELNRLAFIAMGDMNWHAHVGITTAPVRVAVQQKIPLLVWGEHGYLDLCGQFSMDDFPEMNYRDRLEHFARGYEWNYFVGRDGLTSEDLIPWKYPADQEIFELNLRGVYLSNYVKWEANEHVNLVVEQYGFKVSDEPFDRTYRKMSNLDDMHENGVHDYLKYIKFGYGRCTDHACKDIRAGLISREQAVELVRRYDHVKPRDLCRWLDYVGMSEDEFDRIADTFRDPRVWHLESGKWEKENL